MPQISPAIQNYWEHEKGWIKKKHAKSLHWGDFTSWAENETKNDSSIKNISSAAMGSIYEEVDNVFTKGDMK